MTTQLLSWTELADIIEQESPVVAWVLDMVANWTCDEHDVLLCECIDDSRDMPLREFVEVLGFLNVFLGPHRSTRVIIEALNPDRTAVQGHTLECMECLTPYPCALIRHADELARPYLAKWINDHAFVVNHVNDEEGDSR